MLFLRRIVKTNCRVAFKKFIAKCEIKIICIYICVSNKKLLPLMKKIEIKIATNKRNVIILSFKLMNFNYFLHKIKINLTNY